jgi:hypothetical protein
MQSVPITNIVVSLNPTQAIQQYLIKFVSKKKEKMFRKKCLKKECLEQRKEK